MPGTNPNVSWCPSVPDRSGLCPISDVRTPMRLRDSAASNPSRTHWWRHRAFGRGRSVRDEAVVEMGRGPIVFAVVVTGATVWTTAEFDAAKQARIAAEDSDEIVVDSIYSDRIEGQYDADYDRSRYRTIAKSFESDPIFLDGYRAFSVDDAELETIRTEVDGLDVPIYVAFLSNSELDDADGDADLLAARIAAE